MDLTSCLVGLYLLLIDHQPLDPSHSPARSFVVFTGSFLSVNNPPHFEYLHVVVSELGYDDPLDLSEVKLCSRGLIHLTISAPQLCGSFPISEGNGILKFQQSQLFT